MEKETLITAVKTSISEVLEKMFFLPLDFYDTADSGKFPDLDIKKLMNCRLDFGGPFSGFFLLFIPMRLAQSMTADFVGENESNVSPEQVTETVKEIVNMIAGNAFSIYDEQAVFNLDIPKMVSPDKAEAEIKTSNEDIFIAITTIDDNHLTVHMVIDS
jgi:CheY-specific phosphatase CheX